MQPASPCVVAPVPLQLDTDGTNRGSLLPAEVRVADHPQGVGAEGGQGGYGVHDHRSMVGSLWLIHPLACTVCVLVASMNSGCVS